MMRLITFMVVLCAAACGDADEPADTNTGSGTDPSTSLGGAWEAFSENVTVYMDGDEVVIESNGLPDHTSPYWSPDHPLHVDATVAEHLVPGYIDDFNGSYTLRVPANPQLAATSSATTLGPVGIARSGSMIYNDEEGPGRALDDAAGGLDYNGAHTGPSSYHYHLEPTAWSEDDHELIGIMADGFFLFGRRDSEGGDYPTDLDVSGGHTGPTQYNDEDTYHYHIVNELYAGQYYILFAEDYQGTPSNIQ